MVDPDQKIALTPAQNETVQQLTKEFVNGNDQKRDLATTGNFGLANE
jgi:hypothetical protein